MCFDQIKSSIGYFSVAVNAPGRVISDEPILLAGYWMHIHLASFIVFLLVTGDRPMSFGAQGIWIMQGLWPVSEELTSCWKLVINLRPFISRQLRSWQMLYLSRVSGEFGQRKSLLWGFYSIDIRRGVESLNVTSTARGNLMIARKATNLIKWITCLHDKCIIWLKKQKTQTTAWIVAEVYCASHMMSCL